MNDIATLEGSLRMRCSLVAVVVGMLVMVDLSWGQLCSLRTEREWARSPASATIVDGTVVAGIGRELVILDTETLDVQTALPLGDLSEPIDSIRVVSRGTSVFATYNGSLVEIDVTDLSMPSIVAETPFGDGPTEDIMMVGSRVWIALEAGGLVWIDVDAQPAEVVSFADDLRVQEIWVTDERLLALAGPSSYSEWLDVFDLSDPALPAHAGRLPLEIPLDVVSIGDQVVVAERDQGLALISLTDAGVPVLDSRFARPGRTSALAVDGARLIVGTPLDIFELDPVHGPVQTGRVDGVGGSNLVVGGDSVVFLGTSIVRVDDLYGDPQIVASHPRISNVNSVEAIDQGVFVVTTSGQIWIVDPDADPHEAEPLMRSRSTRFAIGTHSNGYAYIGAWNGLDIIDLWSNPEPESVWFDDSLDVRALRVDSGRLFVRTRTEGTRIYDIADPGNPQLRSTETFDGYPHALAVQDELLVLTTWAGGNNDALRIYDVSDLDAPVLLSAVNIPGVTFSEMKFEEELLFAASSGEGLLVFDLTDSSDPRLVGHYPDIKPAFGFDVRDRVVFIPEQGTRMHVLDFASPETPTLRTFPILRALHVGLALDGDHLYYGRAESLVRYDVAHCFACDCDFNLSGDVTIVDLLGYVDEWLGRGPLADMNGDSEVSVLDLLLFVDCWLERAC